MIEERVNGRQPTTTGIVGWLCVIATQRKMKSHWARAKKLNVVLSLQQQVSLHYQDAFFFQRRNFKGKKWERPFDLFFFFFFLFFFFFFFFLNFIPHFRATTTTHNHDALIEYEWCLRYFLLLSLMREMKKKNRGGQEWDGYLFSKSIAIQHTKRTDWLLAWVRINVMQEHRRHGAHWVRQGVSLVMFCGCVCTCADKCLSLFLSKLDSLQCHQSLLLPSLRLSHRPK